MGIDIQSTVKNLHPLEVRIILFYKKGDELSVEKVEKDLDFKPGNGNQALSWLTGKGIVSEIRRETSIFYELTDLGRQWKEKGTPEERIIELIRIKQGLRLPEIAQTLGLDNKDVGSAFGALSKLGVLALDGEKRVIVALPPDQLVNGRPAGNAPQPGTAHSHGAASGDQPTEGIAGHFALVRGLLNKAASAEGGLLAEADLSPAEKAAMGGIAKKRGAADAPFRQADRETVIYGFATDTDGAVAAEQLAAALKATGITGDEIGTLTPEMLETGSWKGKAFRSYNVKVPPTRLIPGRTNPYAKFLEDVKDKLSSLGFEEFDGPLVETEFWNSDALFMPQFHSARDIHDVYHVAETPDPSRPASPEGFAHTKSIEEPWLSNVAAAHENGGATGSRGWSYNFDREFTKRLILRSQGTVLSAKTLPKAKIPGKYFGIVRCFRYDQVDATHLSDFYQTEGIVLGEDVNLKTLLGMLDMFAREVAGAKEVKYVPGYFPFTEPSVEVHIKHPVLGWFELGGSGIFRPEVTASLGVDVPVAAWGIGIDRMALMALGLNDLRELFSYDIENVRLRRTKEGAV
ncbi:phenylalanyl-tRNA synthetase alpha chain (Phenylalanine--tRNA ligase alpha chain) (PheRS) [Treponema primitia ZAS-2]|uniref:phenylalanine--tRNA ligase n=1 Tax=Treponema primitia (strain ATCC BAA-887 / DSM 12427 / ZAS-2) TaxID=545694 RepID=F5YM46_TREPZ|nr:phenylalanine--tRNA ligase subunit alpha [Treponema primitia]AEF86584.1 phenylalanyl-tRNA synthetase alpha chain (Phenylalanine--tRNA ligase alpha chain) (PheRS) [Treponema primitia ZAS-2]